MIRRRAQETAHVPIWHGVGAPFAPTQPVWRARKHIAASTGRALLSASAGRVLPAIAAATAAATAATTATATALAIVATTTATATVVTAATAVAAIATATAATTITATTTPEAPTTAAAAEATTAASAALLPLLGFVHPERAPVERATIHPLDRLGGFLGGAHGHEGKAAGAAGLTIRDQVDIADRSELLERRTYALCIGVE